MTISYYIHVWQGLLMFLAGVVSLMAAFAGYIQSGGGEELLRRALANLETGAAQFDDIDFHRWREGTMVVTNLRHVDFKWPKQDPIAEISGLHAEAMDVQANLLPWPPSVKGITVRGMHDIAINLSEAFLQSGLVQGLKAKEIPAIEFEDCNLKLVIGDLDPLVLTGCSGVLRRDSRLQETAGVSASETPLRGSFSLSQLNGRPFNFKMESLEDGRWVLTGRNIQIDTAGTLRKRNPFAGKLDPVGLLVRALFSGEMGAKGTVDSLRIVVQPASGAQPFSCDGEVGYSSLMLRLPPASEVTGTALPYFLGQLLGADQNQGESPWPRWMQMDRIRTGENGRVAFHMENGVLNFACDEGPGSAFTGTLKEREFPRLEALKGLVETDASGHMRRINFRGFLGDQLSFETRIERAAGLSRTYELILEPRAGDSKKVVFGKPLWRFVSRARDYFALKNKGALPAGAPLADFELEGDGRHFPIANWLPPGVLDLVGHVYARGQFTDDMRLKFSAVDINDGTSLLYGGPQAPGTSKGFELGPLWKALETFFATDTPWKLRDVALHGEVEFEFIPVLNATLKNCTMTSGTITHAGLSSDAGFLKPQLSARYQQGDKSRVQFEVTVPKQWQIALNGEWTNGAGGAANSSFSLREKDVPFLLHPQRQTLDPRYVSDDKRRVNRTTTVRIDADGRPVFNVVP